MSHTKTYQTFIWEATPRSTRILYSCVRRHPWSQIRIRTLALYLRKSVQVTTLNHQNVIVYREILKRDHLLLPFQGGRGGIWWPDSADLFSWVGVRSLYLALLLTFCVSFRKGLDFLKDKGETWHSVIWGFQVRGSHQKPACSAFQILFL